MKYSKLLSLLAASTIVASLFAGCQKADQPVEEPKVEQKEEKTRTIGEESETSIELANELDTSIESICISYGKDGDVSENLLLDEPVKTGEKVVLYYDGEAGDVNITFIPENDENQYTVTLDKPEDITAPVVIKKDDDNKVIVTVEDEETKEETVIDVKSEPVKKEEVKEEPKKEETKKEESPKTEPKKEETKPSTNSNNSSNNSSSNNSNSNNNGGSSSNSSNTSGTHTHNYNIPITTTVHHDAEYQTVTVTDQPAWDEPVWEWIPQVTCNGCGATFSSTAEFGEHGFYYLENGDGSHGSYRATSYQAQTGTIHHDAVTHQEQQMIKAAWDEQVVTGYKCSCGATN